MARKILLADDSVTAQNMGRKILTDAGYDVITVNNGSAALKKVTEQKPDLIVLDVYMPGYSGLEVCQRLKDSPDTERIPILLTVGKLEPFKPEEARRVKADAFIIKPFEASELLSALTRMEDRVVPGKSEVSRFSDGRRTESDGDADTGWKNRLRFPSKKKKEEPEPEADTDLVGGASFRNFRRGKSKAPVSAAGKSAAAAAETTVVPDIPRDITPEELDALSALAAKLDAPAVAPDATVAPAAEVNAPVVAEVKAEEVKAEFEVAAPAAEEKTEGGNLPTPVAEQVEVQAPAASAAAEAIAAETAAEPVTAAEVKPVETVHVETLAGGEPAPVDREDEPIFAASAVAAETVPQAEKVEVTEVPAANHEGSAEASPSEPTEIQAKAGEPTQDERKVEEAPPVVEAVKTEEAAATEEPKIEEPAQPGEPGEGVPALAAAEESEVGPAPSDEELAEALRLLTPALGHSDPSCMPTRETLVAAGAVLAEQVARNAVETPRWVASAVALSPEEAGISLETEMFQTLAGAPAEAKAEIRPEAPAETIVAVAGETTAPSIESVQAEQKDSPANFAEQAADEPATATFADAVQQEIAAVSARPDEVPVTEVAVPLEAMAVPAVEAMEISSSEAAAEGEEAMAKERAKSGKSNWHQIRTGPTSGAQDVVEAAKQDEPTAEAPKAMAAAAAAETASVPLGASDPSAIASIVDSVLADLRPKIVEEIAKKLAGK